MLAYFKSEFMGEITEKLVGALEVASNFVCAPAKNYYRQKIAPICQSLILQSFYKNTLSILTQTVYAINEEELKVKDSL